MEARFTKAHLILYANAVGRCMVAEYRYHNERAVFSTQSTEQLATLHN